jgi:hypothetical protein
MVRVDYERRRRNIKMVAAHDILCAQRALSTPLSNEPKSFEKEKPFAKICAHPLRHVVHCGARKNPE